jgi:hypothetical protein
MLTFKEHMEQNLDERSPYGDLKVALGKLMFKKEYLAALKMMKDKGKRAADAARIFRHVDAKELDKLWNMQQKAA